jgi:hypothetical protein
VQGSHHSLFADTGFPHHQDGFIPTSQLVDLAPEACDCWRIATENEIAHIFSSGWLPFWRLQEWEVFFDETGRPSGEQTETVFALRPKPGWGTREACDQLQAFTVREFGGDEG